MDSTGRDRWESKAKQHRSLRSALYNVDKRPDLVYEEIAQSLGQQLHDWINIYQDSFRRERTSVPEVISGNAKREIKEIIKQELAEIERRVEALWPQDKRKTPSQNLEPFIKNGKEHLALTVDVLRHKCFEAIENLRSERSAELVNKRVERWERWLQIAVSSVAGGIIAIFSAWLTNRWNRQSLEPLVKLSAENVGKYDLIDISSGTLKVDVTNIGPNDVADVGIYLNEFHATPGWDKITLNELRPLRFATIPRLSSGNTKIVPIGKETGFHWENLLKNEEAVFRKDPKFKGMLPFVRIQARYRRALGGQLFYTTAIYAVQGATLIEWDFPRNRDEFLAGYSR